MSKSLRLDPNNPKDRALIERTQGGKEELRKYYKGKNLNQEEASHNNHRRLNKDLTEMTESSSKYHNVICYDELFGTKLKFDSIWERECFYKLKNLENKTYIQGLKTQVPIDLIVNGYHICKFIIDFRFVHRGELIYLDAKSSATMPAGARYKVNLFRALRKEKLELAFSGKESIINEIEKYYAGFRRNNKTIA